MLQQYVVKKEILIMAEKDMSVFEAGGLNEWLEPVSDEEYAKLK